MRAGRGEAGAKSVRFRTVIQSFVHQRTPGRHVQRAVARCLWVRRFAAALAEQRRPANGIAECRATTMPDRDNFYFQRLGAREGVGQRSLAYTRLSESEQAYTG